MSTKNTDNLQESKIKDTNLDDLFSKLGLDLNNKEMVQGSIDALKDKIAKSIINRMHDQSQQQNQGNQQSGQNQPGGQGGSQEQGQQGQNQSSQGNSGQQSQNSQAGDQGQQGGQSGQSGNPGQGSNHQNQGQTGSQESQSGDQGQNNGQQGNQENDGQSDQNENSGQDNSQQGQGQNGNHNGQSGQNGNSQGGQSDSQGQGASQGGQSGQSDQNGGGSQPGGNQPSGQGRQGGGSGQGESGGYGGSSGGSGSNGSNGQGGSSGGSGGNGSGGSGASSSGTGGNSGGNSGSGGSGDGQSSSENPITKLDPSQDNKKRRVNPIQLAEPGNKTSEKTLSRRRQLDSARQDAQRALDEIKKQLASKTEAINWTTLSNAELERMAQELEKQLANSESISDDDLSNLSDTDFDDMCASMYDAAADYFDSGDWTSTANSEEENELRIKEINNPRTQAQVTKDTKVLKPKSSSIDKKGVGIQGAKSTGALKRIVQNVKPIKGIEPFLNDVFNAVADQVLPQKQRKQVKKYNAHRDWALTGEFGDEFFPEDPIARTNIEEDKLITIQIYLDCSYSWSRTDHMLALQAIRPLIDLQEDGQLKIELFGFNNQVFSGLELLPDVQDVQANRDKLDSYSPYIGGGTHAWHEILANIEATRPTNVVILTDDDMESQGKPHDRIENPVTVPGIVWFLWHGDMEDPHNHNNTIKIEDYGKCPAPSLPLELQGEKATAHYII